MESTAQTEMKLRDKFIIDAIDYLKNHDKQLTDQERNFRVDMARKVKLHKDITTQEYDSLQELANKIIELNNTLEVCPHCMSEVTIPSNIPSACPECKEIILPCSACEVVDKCDWNEENRCTKFPLKESL